MKRLVNILATVESFIYPTDAQVDVYILVTARSLPALEVLSIELSRK